MTAVDDFLEHYGVKGMKWGVRQARQTVEIHRRVAAGTGSRTDRFVAGSQVSALDVARGKGFAGASKIYADRVEKRMDRKWQKNIYKNKGAIKVHNGMAREMNSQIDAINAKHNISEKSTKKQVDAYHREIETKMQAAYANAVESVHGESPSGSKRAVYEVGTDGSHRISVRTNAEVAAAVRNPELLSHADTETAPDITIELEVKANRVVGFRQIQTDASHSDPVGEFLEHYGVKGMKWGVTKSGDTSSTSTKTSHLRRSAKEVTVTQKPGRFVRTSGGQRQTASSDAIKVAAARQVAKKSTTDSLTNKQMADAVSRMNLEKQFSKLSKEADRRDRSRRAIDKVLGNKRGQQAAKSVGSLAFKTAVKAAAAA